MQGYGGQIIGILLINTLTAYSAYLPLSCGQLNLGVAGFMVIGAYVSAIMSNAGIPIAATVAAASATAAAAGLSISYLVLRAKGIYFTIATLAFAEAVVSLLLNIPSVGGASGLVVAGHLAVWPILLITAFVAALVINLMGTRFGLCLTAIRNDTRGTAVFGVGVRDIEVVALTLSAAIAGLAGALYAHEFNYIEAQNFNVLLSTYAVLYVLLGGLQTPLGPLLGATIFTLAPEILRGVQEWRYVVFGAAIVILMVLRPQGILTRSLLHNFAMRRTAL